MDRIVYGISAINFERDRESGFNENLSPNQCLFVRSPITNRNPVMADDSYKSVDLHFMTVGRINDFINNQSATDTNDPHNSKSDESELDTDNDLNNSDPCTSSAAHMLNNRRLLSRACKESNALHKTKRRSIMKPKRLLSKAGDLRPAEIRKIYLNKKLGNFHPTKLETIFEEPLTTGNGDDCDLRLIGARKVKRSISCSDGVNVNKTLIKQRRLKIKKMFGKRFALKKILLEDFMQRLNKSFEDDPVAIEGQNDKNA